jgi:hypothetical protein
MRGFLLAGVAAAAVSTALPASAAVVVFSEVKAAWSDAVINAPNNLSYSGNGTGHASVKWGTSTGYGQSGYKFDALSIAPIVIPPAPVSAFTLGKFTHNNWPITGNSLTAVKLTLTTNVTVDGASIGPYSFAYDFVHHETPNGGWICPYSSTGGPGWNTVGVNANGCADKVETEFNSTSDLFQVGNDFYTLKIAGFLVDGEEKEVFITKEKKANVAYLKGRIDYSHSIAAVPEPATWAMMLLGFFGLGSVLRRERARRGLALA